MDQKEKFQQELLIKKIAMEDTITEWTRKNELLVSKLESYENGWEEEIKFSNENKETIMKLESELIENKSFFSVLKFQNDDLVNENIELKEKIEENTYSILKLEERAVSSEQASEEWEQKYDDLKCTHSELSLKQKEREESLLEQLEVSTRRGDCADNDLQKHMELISFINKLSTEGEAGRAKARRLSEAVFNDSSKISQNKENVYMHNHNNSYDKKNDVDDHNNYINCSYNSSNDDNKNDSLCDERSRKVRKPSKI